MKSIFTFLTIGTLAFGLTACNDAHDHDHAHDAAGEVIPLEHDGDAAEHGATDAHG